MPLPVYWGQDHRPIRNRNLDTPDEIEFLNSRGFGVNHTNYLYDVFNSIYDRLRQQALNAGNDLPDAHIEALEGVNNAIRDYEANTQTPVRLPDNYIPQHETFGERPVLFYDLTTDDEENNTNPNVIPEVEPPAYFDLVPPADGVNVVGNYDTDESSEWDMDLEPLPLYQGQDNDDEYMGAGISGYIEPHTTGSFFAMN